MNLTELRECVDLLEELAPTTTRKRRMAEVERLTDEYIESTGRVPDGALLERMTNVILHEELTDNDEHKMSRNEYPILSDSMYERRVEGKHQSSSKRKDKLIFREVPLSHARNIGTDGNNYNTPSRF
jgi:hypothetical protein